LAVPRSWLAVLNAFPTLSCILLKLKHSWNIHQTFILLTWSPVTMCGCQFSSALIRFNPSFRSYFVNRSEADYHFNTLHPQTDRFFVFFLQVLAVGPTGSGKTLCIGDKLLRHMPKDYLCHFLAFSARTSANQTQDIIDGKLDKRCSSISSKLFFLARGPVRIISY
jgi:hypothetical protein